MESMTIGQLAAAAGVNVETVRYYQRRNLLAVAARARGRGSSSALNRLVFRSMMCRNFCRWTMGSPARQRATSVR
jgi:hypothetical protein